MDQEIKKILGGLIEAHNKGPLPLFQHGRPLVDVTYIDNFVDAVVLATESDRGLGRVFNISNGDPQPVIDLLQELFKQLDVTLKTKPMSVSFEMLARVLGISE